MKLFRSVKIAPRLVISFLIVAMLTAAIGVIGITNLRTTNSQYADMYEDYGVSQGTFGKIAISYYTIRLDIRNIVISNDPAQIQKLVADIDTQKEAILTTIKSMSGDIKKLAETNKLQDSMNAFFEDLKISTGMLKAGDKEGAMAWINKAGPALTTAAQKSVLDSLDMATKNGESTAKSLSAGSATSTYLMLGFTVLAFVIALILGVALSSSVNKPLRELVSAASKVAKGDIDVSIDVRSKDEIGILAKAFNKVIDAIGRLAMDTNMLMNAAKAGKLSARADDGAHDGAYKTIVEGVNETLDAVVTPLGIAAGQLSKMAEGEDLEVIDEDDFSGDFKTIAINLNKARESLYRMLGDITMLSDAAVSGKLSARADVTQHKGGYSQIIKGINDTLDAIIEPIGEAGEVLSEISQGNLGQKMTGDYKGDNAVIKIALNNTIDTLRGYIGDITTVLADIANGNLDTGISSEYHGDFTEIKNSINNITASLNMVMGDIGASAEQVASGTQQVSSGAQALSQGATEQASAIEQLTASLAEIAGQTKLNAVNAGQASDLAVSARDEAVEGNNRMNGLQQAMKEINDASANISKIIKVIDDIAFQTNLLALNAAVEAARAGQHGKGFAVVAEEVRNLAQRSANAARETTDMIEESIKRVKAGTALADETAKSLTRIVSGVEKVSGLVGGIATASSDQATAVAQVNGGIGQVSQVTQTNSATAEESAAASEELSSQAALLKEMVGRFNLQGQGNRTGTPKPALSPAPSHGRAASAKPRIALDGGDFGKY